MNGEVYGVKDMDKLVTDFEDVESISVSNPKTAWSKIAKTPEYGGEGGGQKISTSTQELMTAAIVLLGKKYDSTEITVDDASKIIEEAKGKFSDIVGATGKETLLNQFTENWYDLATAISSANAIFEIVPRPSKVFWTGQSWDDEIKAFNPPIGNIKDYNSSDIVVKGGNKYYGFSLKKKRTTAAKTQHLSTNQSLVRNHSSKILYLNRIWHLLNVQRICFLSEWLSTYKKTTNYSAIRKLSEKEFKKEISKIPNDFANDMLAGRGG